MLYGPSILRGYGEMEKSLNPYFFGKCSTAHKKKVRTKTTKCLNPYFFGKCSTAKVRFVSVEETKSS